MKLAILRALSPGYRLGVAWWLYPDESHNNDGRHVGYLQQPECWRHLDPDLFDALERIVSSSVRLVSSLENSGLLGCAVFASDPIPVVPVQARPQARRKWFEKVKQTLGETDIIFVDPDNGLEPASFSVTSGAAGKSIAMSEVCELAGSNRCLVIYHHQTRHKGGHVEEIEHCGKRLRDIGFDRVDALRAKPYSPRAFYLISAPDEVRLRAADLSAQWHGLISWHPDVGRRENGFVSIAAALTPERMERHSLLATSARVARKPRQSGTTTKVGYMNRNRQQVIRATGLRGTDHGQSVYILRCADCGHEYGVNGSGIFQCRCPAHGGGAPGLSY